MEDRAVFRGEDLGSAAKDLGSAAKDLGSTAKDSGAEAKESGAAAGAGLGRNALFTMIAFGISGAIAMIYEVAWTRTLCLVIGSTTYAFSIMLSTFLIGISFGSLQSARLADKCKDPTFWFAVCQIGVGLAAFCSIMLLNYLPYWNIIANHHNENNPELGMCVRFLLAGSVLLPVSFFLGSIFPLAIKSCTLELSRVGRSVGTSIQ